MNDNVVPTAPPVEEEVRRRISKTADYVLRNGPQFESTIVQKENGNARFSFLLNGENSLFYRWSLLCLTRKYSPETVNAVSILVNACP